MESLLLVEDDPLHSEAMNDVLSRRGYQVDVAEDAAEALKALRARKHYDAAVLDIMLPLEGALDDGQGGLEAGVEILRRMRHSEGFAHRRHLPVLCYTVRAVTPRIRRALEQLGAVVLGKGGEPEEFIEVLQRMLGEMEAET